MKQSYTMAPLGDVIRQRSEFIEIDDFKAYKRCRVQMHAQGIVLRDKVQGNEIKTKKQQVCHAGEFLVAEIDAKVGGFGIVPDDLDDAIVSSHYFLFDLDTAILNRSFLGYFVRTPAFMDQVRAQGTTNYAAIRPGDVLSYKVPLPSLEEQQRIVARIEELVAKIEEARGLRWEAVEEVERLIALVVSNCFSVGVENGWKVGQLEDYVINDCYGTSEKTTDDGSGTPILRMGNIQNGHIDIHDLKYLHLSDKERAKLKLIPGDILVNRTNSAELVGKCAVFNLEGEYGFASYLIRLRLDLTRVEPRLVAAYINSPAGRAYMFNERKQMTGQANVNATKLKALPIALPSLAEQYDILDYLDNLQSKMGTLKQLQSEISAELDALLPSVLDKAFKGEL